jgi:coproporphyrinogen III oxidase
MIQVKNIALTWWLIVCINYVSAFRGSFLNGLKRADLSAVAQDTGAAIGWDSHKAVDNIPESLVRTIDGNAGMRKKFEQLCRNAQADICKAIEEVDGVGKFRSDAWVRENGGGGISRVLSGGKVFEKAGVNLSVVYGSMPKEALQAATERGADRTKGMKPGESVPFFACGLSSVMHPRNPHCPTMHFNYRYFETDGGVWWFGGGTDITPSYLDVDDMKHFHGVYKNMCDKHDSTFYPTFKKWADKYFLIAHRGETRGCGGIFYDDLNDRDPEMLLALARDGLAAVVPAYVPIIEKHKNDKFTPEEKEWQLLRRGRYTEFNLVYDRGTVFGLKTGGRIESILMSLPEYAKWEYDHLPAPGSKEEEIMNVFKNPRDWV